MIYFSIGGKENMTSNNSVTFKISITTKEKGLMDMDNSVVIVGGSV